MQNKTYIFIISFSKPCQINLGVLLLTVQPVAIDVMPWVAGWVCQYSQFQFCKGKGLTFHSVTTARPW